MAAQGDQAIQILDPVFDLLYFFLDGLSLFDGVLDGFKIFEGQVFEDALPFFPVFQEGVGVDALLPADLAQMHGTLLVLVGFCLQCFDGFRAALSLVFEHSADYGIVLHH